MGDRASISFKNGMRESVAFFSHWDGGHLFNKAHQYAEELVKEVKDRQYGPLDRLEPQTVMVDFIRWYVKDRVTGNYYLGIDQQDGDNGDNGHYVVDLKAIRERHRESLPF